MRKHALSAVAAALVMAPGLVAAEIVETIERSFEISGIPSVLVKNEDGRTNLTAHDGATVEVRAVKEVLHASSDEQAREVAESVEVRIEEHDGRVHVETRYPERDGSLFDRARLLVHLEISAPRRSDLDVETEDGPLTVRGFDGRVRLVSEDGDVDVSDCGSELDVRAEDGDVELRSIRGAVSVRLEDGDLHLDGELTDLDAVSEDGGLDIEIAPGSSMAADWTLRADDGRVTLRLPESFAAELDIRTDDGSASVDHPGASGIHVSDEHWTATLGGGGHRLSIRTEDGSVRVRGS